MLQSFRKCYDVKVVAWALRKKVRNVAVLVSCGFFSSIRDESGLARKASMVNQRGMCMSSLDSTIGSLSVEATYLWR